MRRVSAGRGAGGLARDSAEVFGRRAPPPPPGVPLDPVLSRTRTSGALSGRAFVRAGPSLEFDPRCSGAAEWTRSTWGLTVPHPIPSHPRLYTPRLDCRVAGLLGPGSAPRLRGSRSPHRPSVGQPSPWLFFPGGKEKDLGLWEEIWVWLGPPLKSAEFRLSPLEYK